MRLSTPAFISRLDAFALASLFLAYTAFLNLPFCLADNTNNQSASYLLNLSIQELLNTEVVTASKKPQKSTMAPATVFIITRSDIEHYGYRTLGEALKMVPGVYTSSDRNYDYIGVRGFARPGDFNTRILLLVDGHRINDSIYDQANIGEDFPVDIDAIERIEFIKGPGSSLWGTNALLGIINVITRSGSSLSGGAVSAGYGSHARTKGVFQFGEKLHSGLEYSTALSAMESRGERRIFFPEFNNSSDNFGVAEKLDSEEAYRGYLKASYEGLSLSVLSGWRRKEVPTASFGMIFNEDGPFTVDTSTRVEVDLDRDIHTKNNSKILLRLYYDKVRYYGDLVFDSSEEGRTVFDDRASSNLIGTEIRYSQDITQNLSLISGAEAQHAYDLRFKNSQREPIFFSNLDRQDDFQLLSYYAELDCEIYSSLHLVGGGRLDKYSTFRHEISPRAALVYIPVEGSAIKFLYGEAFRAPNDYERNYFDEPFIPDVSLTPEEVRSYELVLEQTLSQEMLLNLSVFHFDLNDIITQTDLGNELIQFQNLEGVESVGLEALLVSRFKNGISSYLGFSFLRVEDDRFHSRISNSPRQLGSAGISIPLWKRSVYISPEIQYLGDRLTLQNNTIEEETVVNLTILNQLIHPDITIGIGVYNLFDERQFSPGAVEHRQDQIPLDGRTYTLRLNYNF